MTKNKTTTKKAGKKEDEEEEEEEKAEEDEEEEEEKEEAEEEENICLILKTIICTISLKVQQNLQYIKVGSQNLLNNRNNKAVVEQTY